MKVLYVSESFCTHDARFVKAILEQGHHVNYSSLKDKPLIPDEFSDLERFTFSPFHMITSGASDSDVAHIGPIDATTLKLLPQLKIPSVYMSWGSDVLVGLEKLKVDPETIKEGISSAKAFITDCTHVTKKIKELIQDNDIPIYQFPWGIQPERYLAERGQKRGQEIRKALGWRDNEVFISMRKWEASYGILELIEAFRIVVKERPSARLLLLSSGSMKSYVNRLIETYRLKSQVFMPGIVEEEYLPDWLYAADIYVSASKSDGSSISLLEAMACKLPVIVHGDFGNLDWVKAGENGWTTNCHSSLKLGQTLLLALQNKDLWKKMGEVNRKSVLVNADWTKNSSQLSLIYQKLVKS